MQDLWWVIVGSALGGIARHWLSGLVGSPGGDALPWGTIVVNVSGALAIGVLAGAIAAGHAWLAEEATWRFLVIGLLGSYTTVSSFSLQTLLLAHGGKLRQAVANVVLSLTLCLAAAAIGLGIGARLAPGT